MDSGDYTFGIISEGPTDQKVIKNILAGFTKNKNISLNALQPKKVNLAIGTGFLNTARLKNLKVLLPLTTSL